MRPQAFVGDYLLANSSSTRAIRFCDFLIFSPCRLQNNFGFPRGLGPSLLDAFISSGTQQVAG